MAVTLGLQLTCAITVASILAAAGIESSVLKVENESRPIDRAVKRLAEQHGVVVTYEDTPLIHSDDLEDSASLERRRNGEHTIIPRRKSFAISYTLNATGQPVDLRGLLDGVVKEGSLPGQRFRIEATGPDELHIIGVGARDQTGSSRDMLPLLDTRISIPPMRSTDELGVVNAAVQAIRRVRETTESPKGERLIIGTVKGVHDPLSFPGADNVPAREILETVLVNGPRKHAWALLCAPDFGCALNVREVVKK